MSENAARHLKKVSFLLALLLLSVYLLSISSSSSSRNSGEGFIRIAELEFLIEYGELGWDSDVLWGTLGRDGKRYNWHQFGQNLIVGPVYYLMSWAREKAYAFYLVNILANIATTLVLVRILVLAGFSVNVSVLCGIMFGLGTLSWVYAAKMPHEHALAVASVVLAVYFAMKYRHGLGRSNLWLCLLSLGYGFTVRYDTILSLLPLGYYLWSSRGEKPEDKYTLAKALFIAALVLAPFALFNLSYNYLKFGSFLESGYAGSNSAPQKLFGLEFIPRGLIGALFSPGKSIFLFSPVLLLAPFGLRSFVKRVGREFSTMVILFILMYLLFYSCHHSWDGDWGFGPRYFLVLIPFMIFMAAPLFETFKDRSAVSKTLISSVLIASLLVQLVFILTDPSIANMIKYGLNDDKYKALSALSKKDYGVHGSWQWLWSFFDLKVAQFLLQFKIFEFTTLFQFWPDESIPYIKRALMESDYSYIDVSAQLMFTYNVWWLQKPSELYKVIAAALFSISALSAWLLVKDMRKYARAGDTELPTGRD